MLTLETEDFKRDNKRWLGGVVIQTDAQLRALGFELFSRIKKKTPVDTGTAQDSWHISRRAAIVSTEKAQEVTLSTLKPDPTMSPIWITNALPYIFTLEYGGYPKPGGSKTRNGFSTQAPRGMVRISIREIVREYKAASRGQV